jgi:hypothetical protein
MQLIYDCELERTAISGNVKISSKVLYISVESTTVILSEYMGVLTEHNRG